MHQPSSAGSRGVRPPAPRWSTSSWSFAMTPPSVRRIGRRAIRADPAILASTKLIVSTRGIYLVLAPPPGVG